MSDPSFNDVAEQAKGTYSQSRAYERDYWNGASTTERQNIMIGRLDYKAVSTETANAYQQELKAKYNQFIGNKFDSLPASVQQVITEALIDRGELPNPRAYEGIGQEYQLDNGDVLVECDRCDESFISKEDFEDHKAEDHGDNDEDYGDAEESYISSMHPDLNREKLKEARRLIAETDEGDLHRNYYFNGDKISQPTLTEPTDADGIKGYNDNPNAGLYNNKIFKSAPSQARDEGLEGVATESMKEICTCGHFGGSTPEIMNQHEDRFQQGHGACKVCNCSQFTWTPYEGESKYGKEFDDEFGGDYDQTAVNYDQTGLSDISEVPQGAVGSDIPALEDVDFSDDEIEPYTVKSEEAWVEKKKGIEALEEDDYEKESEDEEVTELVETRKMHGYSNESIKKELMIKYGASESEAMDKIYSVEVSTNDKVAWTFFGKKFRECNEAEIQELKLYSGADE